MNDGRVENDITRLSTASEITISQGSAIRNMSSMLADGYGKCQTSSRKQFSVFICVGFVVGPGKIASAFRL